MNMNSKKISLPNENDNRNYREQNPLINNSVPSKKEKKVISRQQINKCLMDIEDTNPLKQTVSINQIAPVLQKCFKQPNKKKDFTQALRGVLYKEMQIKVPKTEIAVQEDPYVMVGYGMNAYFDVVQSMMTMFIIITIFALPIYFIYSQCGQGAYSDSLAYPITQFMIGNMGGASMFCHQFLLSKAHADLSCPIGTVLDTNNAVYGLLSSELEQKSWCHQKGLDSYLTQNNQENCTVFLKPAAIQLKIDTCHLQESCDFNLTHSEIVDKTKGKQTLTLKDGACGPDAYLFLQIPCIVPLEYFKDRQIYGLFVGCLAVFIYLFTLVFIDYVKSVQQNKYIDWDVKTITAGDYTIEFDIGAEVYQKFKDRYHDVSNPITEIGQFKLFVTDELETILTAMPALGLDGPEGDAAPVKIAVLTFAYDNPKVISWLKARGSAIRNEEWNSMHQINNKIRLALKNDRSLLDKLQTPCSIFATFQTEEGYQRALNYNIVLEENPEEYARYEYFLDQKIEIQPASEPTDIIWENRNFTPDQRNGKRFYVSIAIFVMLAGSFALIYLCAKASMAKKNKYPKINCQDFEKDYGDRMDIWENDAVVEYKINIKAEQNNRETHYSGSMQCFCSFQKNNDVQNDQLYQQMDIDNNVIYEEPICKIYFQDKLWSMILAQSISFIIIGVNVVLKKLIISLSIWVGEDTLSEQKASIVNNIFYAQFFNTGFLLLIVNGNLSEHKPKWLTQYMKGPIHDYNPEWFSEVGNKIILAMVINATMPIVGVILAAALPMALRALDNDFTFDVYKTKMTSMNKFKDLYTGADYQIHVKYSDCLNVVFITCMYGLGMPILFPIAAVTLYMQWLCERITVAYFVKMPPAMDDSLSTNALNKLKWAPLFLLFNGFWMLDNRQIFANSWTYKQNAIDGMPSNHLFNGIEVNWSTPLLVMSAASIFIRVAQIVFSEQLQKWGFTMSSKDIMVDEDLPNFFTAVRLNQADEIVKENQNLKENYGIEIEDPRVVNILDMTTMPKKPIQGTPWYTLLSNPLYTDAFCYIGAHIDEREKLIRDDDDNDDNNCEQSDIIMILLNLSNIPDEVAQQFDFKSGFQKDFLALMDRYKKNFQNKHGVKFQFQNDKLIQRYLTYKRSRQALRNNLNNVKDNLEMSAFSISQDQGRDRPHSDIKKITVIPRENMNY